MNLSPSGDSKATSDETGCFTALARVRDRLTDVGGSVGELQKIKSGLEDRVDKVRRPLAFTLYPAVCFARNALSVSVSFCLCLLSACLNTNCVFGPHSCMP